MSPRHFVDVRRTLGGPVADRDLARARGVTAALLSTLTVPGGRRRAARRGGQQPRSALRARSRQSVTPRSMTRSYVRVLIVWVGRARGALRLPATISADALDRLGDRSPSI